MTEDNNSVSVLIVDDNPAKLIALAMVLGNIQDAEQYHELTAEYLAQKIADGRRLIDKMSATINDFRNFFRPDKKREPFCPQTPLLAAITWLKRVLRRMTSRW
jgi:hypothetical protein